MNPLALGHFELRRFRGPLPTVALIFVFLIPLLYGAIYLAGNWDPYGRLGDLPVAVVNEDQGTEFQGQTLNAGESFVKNLHDAGTFGFQDTDAAEAEDGLTHGRYYLVIHVPSDFSAALVSGEGEDPRRAQITLRRNDANGFVIGSITGQATNSIARAIDETATKAYFKALFENLGTIKEGMQQAADGAAQLDTGLTSAKDGADKVAAGAAQARDGSQQLATGSAQLADGIAQAHAGSTQLASGLDQLSSGSVQLADGASQVAGGTHQLADKVDPVLTVAAEKLPAVEGRIRTAAANTAALSSSNASITQAVTDLATGVQSDVDQLAAAHPELAGDPILARLKARGDQATATQTSLSEFVAAVDTDVQAANQLLADTPSLAGQAADAKAKIDLLNSGAQQVAGGAATLRDGIARADSGAWALDAGLAQAEPGAAQLADGAAQLSTGLGDLATGSQQLADGLTAAKDGAHELATKLADGASRLPDMTADDRGRVADILSKPADVTMQVDNPAKVYGRGLAPMFFSIALWVLGISAFMLMRPVTGRLLAGRASSFRIALAAWAPMGIVSVVASWLMLAASWIFLDLDPVHPWLLIGLVTLVAVAFSVFAHFLRTGVGLVATGALLVFLILQLSCAGGTYPAPILPPFFRWLHPFAPMTYSIDAFRIVISGGLMSRLAADVTVLVGLTVGSALALRAVIGRKRRATMIDLHPLIG